MKCNHESQCDYSKRTNSEIEFCMRCTRYITDDYTRNKSLTFDMLSNKKR